jgi:hypothetical protein
MDSEAPARIYVEQASGGLKEAPARIYVEQASGGSKEVHREKRLSTRQTAGPPAFNVENRFEALERRFQQSEADAKETKLVAEKAKEMLECRLLQSEADAKNAKEMLERRLLQSEADAKETKVYAAKAKVDAEKAKEALERRLLQTEADAEKRSKEDTKRFEALESKHTETVATNLKLQAKQQERASAQSTQELDAPKLGLAAKPAPTNSEARLEELERKLVQSEVNAEKAMEEARKQFETVKAQLMKQHLIAWEDDNDGSRLPGQWVNIRIFLSSSFVDTQAERDVIIKNIMPRLNFNLQEYYIRVVAVDLRWGVLSHESKSEHAIQQTCLNEIDQCIEKCPTKHHPCPEYPWFVCLRTSRVGWVQDQVDAADQFEQPSRFGWLDEVRKMKLSITELEIFHGLLGRQEPNHGHVRSFVYFRSDDEFIEQIDADRRWLFECEHKASPEGIPENVVKQYSIRVDAAQIKVDFDALNEAIRARAKGPDSPVKVYNYHPTAAETRITGDRGDGKRFGIGRVEVPKVSGPKCSN